MTVIRGTRSRHMLLAWTADLVCSRVCEEYDLCVNPFAGWQAFGADGNVVGILVIWHKRAKDDRVYLPSFSSGFYFSLHTCGWEFLSHFLCASLAVILSNYYDLPFNDILDWRKFSVILKENDVYRLKQILKDISDSEFVALHENLVKVQKHFQWNSPPVKYDAFHMVMYDLWLRHHVIKY
ncbi:hypothetical protein C3L33_18037, partial [Rhododendron williamsianum]